MDRSRLRQLPVLLQRACATTGIGCLIVLGGAAPGRAEVHSPSPAVEPQTAAVIVTTTSQTDGNDIGGRFDIAKVTDVVRQVDRDHVWITYKVSTFAPWRSVRLDRRLRTFVIELNRDAERGSEANVRISRRHRELVAELISNATRQVIQTIRVTRPDDHSFRISGPRALLGARSYFWTSNFHVDVVSAPCGWRHGIPLTCQDSVPDRGWIRMNRPAWPIAPERAGRRGSVCSGVEFVETLDDDLEQVGELIPLLR